MDYTGRAGRQGETQARVKRIISQRMSANNDSRQSVGSLAVSREPSERTVVVVVNLRVESGAPG